MKTLSKFFQAIREFIYMIIHYKTYRKFKKYERLIQKGILDREKEKIKVMFAASQYIPKKIQKGKSLYIPLSVASKAKIKAIILAEFGYKMKVLGLKITDDLKFV